MFLEGKFIFLSVEKIPWKPINKGEQALMGQGRGTGRSLKVSKIVYVDLDRSPNVIPNEKCLQQQEKGVKSTRDRPQFET